MIVSRANASARPVRCSGLRRRSSRWVRVATSLIVAALAITGCGSGGSSHTSSAKPSQTSPGQVAQSSANTLIATGITQADAKRYQQAETTFRDVLVLSPGNKFAWYNLGLLAEFQNHRSAALTSYSRALASDPRYTPAMYNKAILLEGVDPHSALGLYQRIVSINPRAATAYLRESFVYARLGDHAKAAQAHARAAALDPRLATVTTQAQTGPK